jgi:hypothetical protein
MVIQFLDGHSEELLLDPVASVASLRPQVASRVGFYQWAFVMGDKHVPEDSLLASVVFGRCIR